MDSLYIFKNTMTLLNGAISIYTFPFKSEKASFLIKSNFAKFSYFYRKMRCLKIFNDDFQFKDLSFYLWKLHQMTIDYHVFMNDFCSSQTFHFFNGLLEQLPFFPFQLPRYGQCMNPSIFFSRMLHIICIPHPAKQ